MDPRYQPAELAFENRTLSTRIDMPPPSARPFRTHTWDEPQSQVPSYEPPYFSGPTDANGYPIDSKPRPAYATFDNSAETSPERTPRNSVEDLEKGNGHGHSHSEKGKEPVAHDPHEKDPNQPKLEFGPRLKHFTWAWYTLTMSTGGIATLISIQPHPFPGLISIGATFFIVNLFFFAILCAGMILRFTKFPGSFKESIKHEREGLFIPTFFLSVATIITGTQKYVVQSYEAEHPMRGWIITTMAVAFWIYTFSTFCLAVFQYSYLFIGHTYLLNKFMPSWLLPIFPVMLAGTIASVIAADQPVEARMPMIAAGLGCQGLGFTVALMMYAHWMGRLMQVGLPNREHRPALFIGVGPPSFTCLAFIGMANALPQDFDLQRDGLLDGHLLRTMALVCALFLWVLAMWFFMIAVVAVLHSRPKYFHLGWWAMVFPNTGFVIATISIGNSLRDDTILFVGNGLTIAIVTMWAFVLYCQLRAVIVQDIMYPGRDEDVED